MTRKRFVRLVMAAHIDRKRANMIADDVHARGLPYAAAHCMIAPVLIFFQSLFVPGTSCNIKLTFADDEA